MKRGLRAISQSFKMLRNTNLMLSLINITLADPPLTDRPGNTGGFLSIAANEGWRITVLEIT